MPPLKYSPATTAAKRGYTLFPDLSLILYPAALYGKEAWEEDGELANQETRTNLGAPVRT